MNRATEESAELDDVDVEDVIGHLEELEESVSSPAERRDVRQVRRLVEQVPGQRSVANGIRKYTTRDVAEGFIGGLVFSLPLLVEDGVFEIAEWFTAVTVGAVPVVLLINVLFIVCLVAGVLYLTDFRDVRIQNPILGFVPRRLVGVLVVSFAVAFLTMLTWGRLHEADPTTLEAFGRVTVIWTAAALGATLGDILPGESRGHDIRLENVDDILRPGR